jgi:allophanate hydrolase
VAVPAGFTDAGLPFGVTVIAPAFREEALLPVANGIQARRAPIAGWKLGKIAEIDLEARPSPNWISVGVIGAHLSGQPLNHQLLDRGARLVRATWTAGDYKLFALTNTKPLKPGLVRVPGFDGGGVEIEIWTMHESEFGSFVGGVPPPLCIGSCELADGVVVKGFLCEPYATEGMPEITQLGGWRAYLNTLL